MTLTLLVIEVLEERNCTVIEFFFGTSYSIKFKFTKKYFKFVNGSRQIAFREFVMHLRKVINYDLTNSTKSFIRVLLGHFFGEIFPALPQDNLL